MNIADADFALSLERVLAFETELKEQLKSNLLKDCFFILASSFVKNVGSAARSAIKALISSSDKLSSSTQLCEQQPSKRSAQFSHWINKR